MRVVIYQPLVPAYRVPLFERLGALPDIQLTVRAGRSAGSLAGFEHGEHFLYQLAPVRKLGPSLRTQWAQCTAVAFEERFDLLIAPWDAHYVSLGPCVTAARLRRIPVILWGHGYSKRPGAVRDTLRNGLGRIADGVLLYSHDVASRLIESGTLPARQVYVAPNALDQTPIQAARRRWMGNSPALEEFRRLHRLNPSRTLLFISRLEAGNGTELLLRATALLKEEFPGLKTVIIGDGGEGAALKALSSALRIESHTVFTGPIYEEESIAPWMLSATLLCYPVNIGLSLLHAFGYGLPAVTSDNPIVQNPEIEALHHGVNGLLYRHGDLGDMVNRCRQLLTEHTLRGELSINASRTVSEAFSMDSMVHGFERVFAWARQSRSGFQRAGQRTS
jgi:glycosyltransferase involved in cell wall biosynthesis